MAQLDLVCTAQQGFAFLLEQGYLHEVVSLTDDSLVLSRSLFLLQVFFHHTARRHCLHVGGELFATSEVSYLQSAERATCLLLFT